MILKIDDLVFTARWRMLRYIYQYLLIKKISFEIKKPFLIFLNNKKFKFVKFLYPKFKI